MGGDLLDGLNQLATRKDAERALEHEAEGACIVCSGPADTTAALALGYDGGGRDRVLARVCEPHATALLTLLRADLDADAKRLALPFLFGPAVVGTRITVDAEEAAARGAPQIAKDMGLRAPADRWEGGDAHRVTFDDADG